MPQLNLFGNTSIFPDTGSTDIFGNQSSDIFAAEENASDDLDYEDEESEHTQLESSISYILENVIPNPSTSEGIMIAHVLNSFLDLLD